MKVTFNILFLFVAIQIANCQYFDRTSNWTLITTNIFDETYRKVTTISINGDSIVDGKEYMKVYSNDSFRFLIRESDDGIIYIYQPDYDQDLIVYDFNWYVGKTLYYQPWEEYGDSLIFHNISTIDSIQLLDDNYYKCIGGSDGRPCVQGIGSLRGFFSHMFNVPLDGSQTRLLCYYLGGQLVWSNPEFEDCSTNRVNINLRNIEQQITIYPQPSADMVTFKLTDKLQANFKVLKVYNIKGQILCSEDIDGQAQITFKDLMEGVYLFTIEGLNNQFISGRFTIINND